MPGSVTPSAADCLLSFMLCLDLAVVSLFVSDLYIYIYVWLIYVKFSLRMFNLLYGERTAHNPLPDTTTYV